MIHKAKLKLGNREQEELEEIDDYVYPIVLNYLHKDEQYEEDSSLAASHKVIDAYMHKNENRVTYMVRGKCSYTFELPGDKTKPDQEAKLLYCIDSDDVRFVYHRNGRDVYVQGSFTAKEDDAVLKESSGYAEATMLLYKITKDEEDLPPKRFLPANRLEAHFFVNHSFKLARDSTQTYVFDAMEMMVDDSQKVIGSFIYEDASTADLVLNYYSASLEER